MPSPRAVKDVSLGEAGDAVDSSTVVDAVAPSKEPPPEPQANIWTRRLVIFSFWAIAILFGVPTWWKTTTVYRANLPLQSMNDWADGKLKVCGPVFPLRIALETPSLPRSDAQQLLRATQHALDDLNDFSAHHLRLYLPPGVAGTDEASGRSKGHTKQWDFGDQDPILAQEPPALTVRLLSSKAAESPTASLQTHSKILDVFYPSGLSPASASASSVIGAFVANQLQGLFAEEQTILAYLRYPSVPGTNSNQFSQETAAALARRTTRSVKYAPTYHITFSLLTPGPSPSAWEIEEGLRQTFNPLLPALSAISNFTVDTQVQPYAFLSSAVQPVYDELQKARIIRREELGGFINGAEWPLSPNIGAGPTINFILYVADPGEYPLLVNESTSNSWLVPQWGGVVIYNDAQKRGKGNPTSLSAADLQPALVAFTNQLFSLLGLPSTPSESLPLRLSTLVRIRAASLFLSASSTLGSLARLVKQLPSISIPDSVAENVDATLKRLSDTCAALKSGSFELALQNAKAAEGHSEKAFFERSMVGQVYFPDEHKVAVYLPLLGPVAVPLFVAGVREIRSIIKKSRG